LYFPVLHWTSPSLAMPVVCLFFQNKKSDVTSNGHGRQTIGKMCTIKVQGLLPRNSCTKVYEKHRVYEMRIILSMSVCLSVHLLHPVVSLCGFVPDIYGNGYFTVFVFCVLCFGGFIPVPL
jgi:hypothetical protein